MRQEKKVVTVLFADTVGSTELAERLDPEDTYDIIGEAIELAVAAAEEFGGTVKDLAGDGALILFGAPVSHEDDAERAVRAGLRIIDSIAAYAQRLRERGVDDFSMRIGIETGLVVLGPIGGGGRVEYGAVGDTLNTAARLQSLAEPGTVLVGPATFERVSSRFGWGEPRTVALKGKRERVVVRVAEVAHRKAGPHRGLPGITAPLVGRPDELALMEDALSDLSSGRGGVLVLVGDAGIGKSRLVEEVQATAPPGLCWLEARTASFTERTPYAVFHDLFLDAVGGVAGQEMIERLREHVGERADPIAPFVAVLAGFPDTGRGERLAALSEASLRRGLVEAVADVVNASRAGRPLVIVIEDLHWADPSSLDLLGTVTDEIADHVLFVITARHDPGHASSQFIERSTSRGARVVHLAALSPDTGLALLNAMVGADVLPSGVEERLLAEADGNPFYLEELVRSLRDAGALHRVDGRWELDMSVPLEVPPTVEQVILARLDRLSELDRRTLDAACVIGRHFDLELLHEVGGESLADLETSVARLEHLDLVLRSGAGKGDQVPYHFAHVLIQEAAYRALTRRRRAPLHLRAARALEPRVPFHAGTTGLVGRHYRAAGDLDSALDWLVAFAHEASGAQAREEALQAYGDAIDVAQETGLDPASALVGTLRIDRGRQLAQHGDLRAARSEFESVLDDVQASGERALEGQAAAELGFVLAGAADYRAALSYLEAALHIAEERSDAAARITALARLSIVHTNLLRFDLGREFAERALSAARASGDESLLAVALDAQKQVALQLGDRAALEAMTDELEAIHSQNNDLWLLQFVYFERGYLAVGTARWDEAETRLRQALDISRRIGDGANELLHLSVLGWRDRCRGEYASALATLEDVARRAHELGHAEWSAWTSLLLGATFLDLAEPDLAAPRLTSAVESAEEGGARLHLVRAIAQLAWCSALRDDLDTGRDLAASAAAMLGDIVCPTGTSFLAGADAYLATARVRLALGDVASAAALVNPIVRDGRRSGWVEAAAVGEVVLGRCSLAIGDSEDAVARFRDALQIAATAGMPTLERDAHLALASAVMDPKEASHHARLGAEIDLSLRAGLESARLH